ncbi:MAG: histidine phosphatase family protein [Ruminococcus sp.]|nr:histidine phosphatase family protein [Ruminococcus sp.]
MKGLHLSLIRHGRTDANDQGIYIGRTDYPLSEKGIAELYNKMDEFVYPSVAKVYSSPLRRCTETAEILFPEKDIQCIDELIEMNLGQFDGKSADELIDLPEFKEWLKGGAECAPPEGESVADIQLRIFKALAIIIKDMMENDLRHCAVVTHGGIISNMVAGFGLPKVDPKELQAAFGEGYDIHITAALWQRSGAFELLGMTPYEA